MKDICKQKDYNIFYLMETTMLRTEVESLKLSISPYSSLDVTEESKQLKVSIFNCSNNFFGTVRKNILLFKLKITQYIQNNSFPPLDSVKEINIIKLLKRKLDELNKDIDHVVSEGILTLYIDLNDIREFCENKGVHSTVIHLVRTIIEELNSLLKQYFIF